MKKSLLASASLGAIAFATGAQAADLPRKAPVLSPSPAPWNWTGFYVGANIGAVWSRDSVSDDPTGSPVANWIGLFSVGTANANSTGVIGGIQAGYNWQFSSLVVGIEGDISFSSRDHTVSVFAALPGAFDTYRSRLSTLGTVRGRIGWAFDRLLVYGTGGAAFASLKDEYIDPPTVAGFTASPRSGVTGWTAGGGLEYAFADHWTARAEYLHVGLPDRSANVLVFTTPYAFVFKDSLNIARVGINYKF